MRKILAYILIGLWICCMVAVCSCTSTKHVDKSKEKKTEKVDSTVNSRVDSSGVHTDNSEKKTDATIEFLTEQTKAQDEVIQEMADMLNEQGLMTDSLQMLIDKLKATPCNEGGKVVKRTDGTIEISGIKTLKAEILELTKKLDSASVKTETKTELKKEAEQEKTVKKVDKEVKWYSMWMLLILFVAGYVVRGYLQPGKILSMIFKPKT